MPSGESDSDGTIEDDQQTKVDKSFADAAKANMQDDTTISPMSSPSEKSSHLSETSSEGTAREVDKLEASEI